MSTIPYLFDETTPAGHLSYLSPIFSSVVLEVHIHWIE